MILADNFILLYHILRFRKIAEHNKYLRNCENLLTLFLDYVFPLFPILNFLQPVTKKDCKKFAVFNDKLIIF